ncbi:MAG: hypothetical protein DMF63_13795 [Acidobacteria bacterium]|nr:MAG: hypothetical protein DMF63_13795 [Acidobacteriota bacterium]
MKLNFSGITLGFLAAAFFITTPAIAQKKPVKKVAALKPAVFVVLNDGKWIEPIGVVSGGKLGDETEDDSNKVKVFGSRYYKPKTSYPVIFGGAADGSVTVTKSNIGSECGGASADVTLRSTNFKPTALVMALASNVKLKPGGISYRRRPTTAERTKIDDLVRSEFTKNGASASAVKSLHFYNVTAVDVDGDGVPEFIGSYWIAPTANERRLLFFVAEQKGADDLHFGYSEHAIVKPDDIMSGDLKDLEGGRGSELLIDLLDYDGDGVREIFTIGQAFEGNNYYVYKRDKGKWTRVYETYNYRCAY